MEKFNSEIDARFLSDFSGELMDTSELDPSTKVNSHGAVPVSDYLAIVDRISTILGEFVQTACQNSPYEDSLSLRDSLGLESLALVSVILRIGEEFEVDVTDFAMELNSIATVGDLYSLARKLQSLCSPYSSGKAV